MAEVVGPVAGDDHGGGQPPLAAAAGILGRAREGFGEVALLVWGREPQVDSEWAGPAAANGVAAQAPVRPQVVQRRAAPWPDGRRRVFGERRLACAGRWCKKVGDVASVLLKDSGSVDDIFK